MIPTALGDQKQDYNDVIKIKGVDVIKNDYANKTAIKNVFGSYLINSRQHEFKQEHNFKITSQDRAKMDDLSL